MRSHFSIACSFLAALVGSSFIVSCAESASDKADAGDKSDAGDAGKQPLGECSDDGSYAVLGVYDVTHGTSLVADTGTVHASLVGRVSAVGEGMVPADVSGLVATQASSSGPRHWLRLQADGGAEWFVLVDGVPFGFGLKKGSAVSAKFSYAFGGFDPVRIALELNVDDELAYYFGKNAAPSMLELPKGVQAKQGDQLCTKHDPCGNYARYALELTVDGATTSLGTEQQTQLGAYDVWHARTEEQTSSMSQCSDWFVADTTVEIARHAPLFVDGGMEGCEEKAAAFTAFVASHQSCSQDADCRVIGDCGPNADFRSVRTDAADEAYVLMQARCSDTFDGEGFIPRCKAGKCDMEESPALCCGSEPEDAGL